MKVYKVVSPTWTSSAAMGKFKLDYRIGKLTTQCIIHKRYEGIDPTPAPLMAFKSLSRAKRARFRNEIILECEAEESNLNPSHLPDVFESDIGHFWPIVNYGKDPLTFAKYEHIPETPKGTIFCRWIKPLKIIEDPNLPDTEKGVE